MIKISSTVLILFLKTLTPAFFRILMVLWSYERQRMMGNYSSVFPSREKIAKQARCSVDRVKQFNQMCRLYKDSFIIINKKFNSKTKKYASNSYQMSKKLFEMVTILDGLGYFKKWDSIKEELYIKVSENERFIYDKWKSYEQRITHGSPQKLPDNEDSLNPEAKIKVPKDSTHSSLIFNMGLSSKTLHIAEYYCTKQAVIDARNDFHWFVKLGNTVKSPDRLMISLLKKQQLRNNYNLKKSLWRF